MLLSLLLCLITQVNHQEVYWTTQKGTLDRMVDSTGVNVVPQLVDWVNNKPVSPANLTLYKRVRTTETTYGSYFVFEKTFSGTPKWCCKVGNEMVNQPRIYGWYEDDFVYVWGRSFQDLYNRSREDLPKVYLVTDTVTELPKYQPIGDVEERKQGYYENPYLIRVKPPTSGWIVVYTGEMGVEGCDKIYYTKASLGKEIITIAESGDLVVPANTIVRGPCLIDGTVTIQAGGELHDCTIKKDQLISVKMYSGSTLKNCHIENCGVDSCCIKIMQPEGIRLENNYLKGIRGVSVVGQVKNCVTLNNTYEGHNRYTKTGAYFPVGAACVLVGNTIKNSYRGIVAQANNGPILRNLILRNDFVDGGMDIAGGEQLIIETKAVDTITVNPKVGETVLVNGGTGKGQYYIQTRTGPDRPIRTDETSKYSVGNIATENLLILNRVTNCRVGVEFWKYSVNNVCTGLYCCNVPWGYVQNAGKEHGFAFHNELRDSFFQQSTVNLTNKEALDSVLNFKLNRVELLQSPLRVYNSSGRIGEGLFMFKCAFGLTDNVPLGYDMELDSIPLPYPAAKIGEYDHIVVRDTKLNGKITTKEQLVGQ